MGEWLRLPFVLPCRYESGGFWAQNMPAVLRLEDWEKTLRGQVKGLAACCVIRYYLAVVLLGLLYNRLGH